MAVVAAVGYSATGTVENAPAVESQATHNDGRSTPSNAEINKNDECLY